MGFNFGANCPFKNKNEATAKQMTSKKKKEKKPAHFP